MDIEHRLGVEIGESGASESLTRLSEQLAVLKGVVNVTLTELVEKEREAATYCSNKQQMIQEEEEEEEDFSDSDYDSLNVAKHPKLEEI